MRTIPHPFTHLLIIDIYYILGTILDICKQETKTPAFMKLTFL